MKKKILRFLNQPKFLRHWMNWYRPYRGAGIKVTKLADDFSSATVQMPLRGFNTNYVGVHFGGSLYSMIDPFFMLLVMNQLGRDYVVWDIEANIKFISPGKSTVSAQFNVTPEQIQEIKNNTNNNEKYLPIFHVDILSDDGTLVAQASKTLYIRKKSGGALQN